MSGTRHSDTHVEYVLDTATWIGPARGTTPADARAVAELIVALGPEGRGVRRPAARAVVEADLQRDRQHRRRADRAAARRALRRARATPRDLGHLVRDLMDEGKAVAAAAGVTLGEDPWEMNVLATQRGSAHYPSMLEDVEAHRRTEVDMITGALVREARPARRARAAARDDVPPDQGQGGVLGMRVCVVGCGAVGSLFAANLATLDDVEVWAYDLAQEHVDAINRDGLRLTGAGEVVGRLRATTDAAELPACDFGIVATKAMHTEAAIARDRARVRGRLRRDGAERDRQRGGARARTSSA